MGRYAVQIVDQEGGWAAGGTGDTVQEAFEAAQQSAREAANSIQAAAAPQSEESEPAGGQRELDSLSLLIKALPDDCRESVEAIQVLQENKITSLNAQGYLKSPHRMDFLIREIRRLQKKA